MRTHVAVSARAYQRETAAWLLLGGAATCVGRFRQGGRRPRGYGEHGFRAIVLAAAPAHVACRIAQAGYCVPICRSQRGSEVLRKSCVACSEWSAQMYNGSLGPVLSFTSTDEGRLGSAFPVLTIGSRGPGYIPGVFPECCLLFSSWWCRTQHSASCAPE